MSNLDDIFQKRLNEEEPEYPGRRRSWRQVTRRLDAFQAGAEGTQRGYVRYLRIWQAAAAVALLVVGTLWWQNHHLRNQVAQLRSNPTAAQPAVANSNNTPPTVASNGATLELAANSTSTTEPSATPAGRVNDLSELSTKQKNSVSSLGANPALRLKPSRKPGAGSDAESLAADRQKRSLSNAPSVSVAETPAASGSVSPTVSTVAEEPITNLSTTPSVAATPSAGVAQGTENTAATPAQTSEPSVANAANEPSATVTQTDQTVAASAPTPTTPAATTPPPSVAEATRDSMAGATPPAATPPTLVHRDRDPRWQVRVGLRGTLAQTAREDDAISPLKGVGVRAEVNTVAGLRLMASADWMTYSVCADSMPPQHIELPDEPGSPHPGHRLETVEGDFRQQQYSVGLSYAVPLRSRLKPVVHVAHTWLHTPPAFVRFQYRDHNGGGPGGPGGPGGHDPDDLLFKQTDNQWASNNWSAGLGLEYNLPRWAFSVEADYLSAPSQFNQVAIRAGISYKL